MSDDQVNSGFRAYADHLQRTADLAPAAEIRRRGDRRRRNRAAGAAFAVVLIAAVGIGVGLDRGPDRSVPPIGPSASPSVAASRSKAVPSVTSNLSQLKRFGVDFNTGVLIDVADDGVAHWMQVGADDVVDFTGGVKDASTEMSLLPASTTTPNSVVVVPVARPDSCVTDTPDVPLRLQPCQDGDPAQIWELVPAGDSGQFEMKGAYGTLRVDDKLVEEQQTGWVGMQTINF
ncbi:hypothetical protein [Actinoplanes palleronii]|uniref:Ricin B lectin domain-containing protein n=1 Tax=Actinoplanes palleronii TaxID=113570 RepID=A0ABQ4BHX0_9ACTN|nr:hypothetical protein [Actinoplanes palleronii]GIE70279.1 hypothetical protein Apa02nite_063870 [Actinoplanes palleronii]